ncbi:MAG TPA: galactokinase family protein, partial [bacterium]|nr:galactokinase family protein [bacterium]
MKREMGVVIMAGGLGSRMRCSSVHKVCFPLGGEPVINRNLEIFNRCGINKHFIVIRHLAEQVMQTVSSIEGTHYFCYQKEPRGTGNAAKAAAYIISTIPSVRDIMVIAGDKVADETILRKLIEKYKETESDLAFAVGDIRDFPDAGRVVYDKSGSISGIVEVFDIKKMELLREFKKKVSKKALPAEDARKMILSFLKNERKAELAIKPLWLAVKEGRNITGKLLDANFRKEDFSLKSSGISISPASLRKVRYANLSVYLFKREAFLSSLAKISDNNAQKEEYLTDTIGIIAGKKAKITILPVDNPNQIMAFNTPEEIIKIEHYLFEKNAILKEKPSSLRRPLDWLRHLETASPVSLEYFRGIYGNNYPFIESKRKLLISALKDYLEHFDNNPVIITRAPGRINIMGRHIDHQGGDVNMLAIDKDIYCIIGQRKDRQVFAHSMEPYRFPERQFSIESLGVDPEKDWNQFINSSFVLKQLSSAKKDWGRYVKAVLSRFQHFCGKKPVKGMNIMISGDLPLEGGISSSSALFMAIAEGCTYLNDISLSPYRFVELCDEGECFLGNRGGTGDHAAIKYSKKGCITHIGLNPLQIIKTVPFPQDYILAICNSQYQAYKTRGARDTYNQRVACYHIGKELLKQNFPYIRDFVVHLRDIVYGKGNLTEKDTIKMLYSLPLKMSRKEILEKIESEEVRKSIETISPSVDVFPVREILVYGLAECMRSRFGSEFLLKNDIRAFGKLMNISHDGDRVVMWTKEKEYTPFTIDYSDKAMKKLAAMADKKANQLILQSGGYRCSIQEIDRMADITLGIGKVAGVQISGAGLGGYIMVLAK